MPKYLNHSEWEVGKDDARVMNEEFVVLLFASGPAKRRLLAFCKSGIFGNECRAGKYTHRNNNFNNEENLGRQAVVYKPFSLRIAVNYFDIPRQ